MLAWSSRKPKFFNSMELRDRARLAAPVRHTLKSQIQSMRAPLL
jgi:hypothetical protein